MWWIIIIYLLIGLFITSLCINVFVKGKTINDKLNEIFDDTGTGCFIVGLMILLWPCIISIIVGYLMLCLTNNLGEKIKKFLEKNDL